MLNNFPVKLTLASLDVIKKGLTEFLPDVKSSHRVEALARSLGFSTYAALKTALKEGALIKCTVRWIPFRDYLKSKNFSVNAAPLFDSVAMAALAQTIEKETLLTCYGISLADGSKQDFQLAQESLLWAAGDFLRAWVLVSLIEKRKSITPHYNSYRLKHMAEKYPCAYPDGEELGPDYVSNGAMIAAALYAGFDYKRQFNANFNMSKPVLKELEQKIEQYRKSKDESIFDTFKTMPAKAA